MSLESQILSALRAASPQGVSGGQLSDELEVTRAAIWGRIEELRARGYEIVASPHQGYRLMQEPDLLYAPDLLSRTRGNRVVGRDVRVVQETSSTNDLVEKFAREGAPEGLVVFAESQRCGRGRLGRSWWSPPGKGLWFSLLLRPPLQPPAATQLTIVSALALSRALAMESGLEPKIKWPNDILIGGRKVAGILIELKAELDEMKYVIAGLGVNINLTSADFPRELRPVASSLKIESRGRHFMRPALAAAILREIDRDYFRLLQGEFASLAAEWEEQCCTLGRTVTIQMGSRRVSGAAEALDENGALLLRTEHGLIEKITGGDLTQEAARAR